MESAGGVIAFNSAMRSGRAGAGGIAIAADAMELEARLVINAAGLFAPALARTIEGMPAEAIPKAYFAKGNYFALSGARSPFHHLIYPMPGEAGLGIHATLDLGGGVRFGPDVEWVEAIDYAVDSARAEAFYSAIRRYWPGLPEGALAPAYSGIRPKIVGPGEAAAGFMIQGPQRHGIAGLWNLFGIESPGLTASLALAAELRHRIEA
jgi:L-2-hydroxyglutarate oxidase LhgO